VKIAIMAESDQGNDVGMCQREFARKQRFVRTIHKRGHHDGHRSPHRSNQDEEEHLREWEGREKQINDRNLQRTGESEDWRRNWEEFQTTAFGSLVGDVKGGRGGKKGWKGIRKRREEGLSVGLMLGRKDGNVGGEN
jgi:hypothetical protein